MQDDEALNIVREFLEVSIVESLRLQGHTNTGKLASSIETKVSHLLDGTEIGVYMEDYAKYVDQGVGADSIPFSEGSGQKKSKYIQALARFAISKGIASGRKQAESIAFAIAKTHKKEGMPTRASQKFSSTGKRTGFLSDAFTDQELEVLIDRELGKGLQTIVDNLVIDTQKLIN